MAKEKNKKPNAPESLDEPKITGEERRQRGLLKKYRGGVELTQQQVREIKEGRKKLRREMMS